MSRNLLPGDIVRTLPAPKFFFSPNDQELWDANLNRLCAVKEVYPTANGMVCINFMQYSDWGVSQEYLELVYET